MHPVKLSQELLYAVKIGKPTEELIFQLSAFSEDELFVSLKEISHRKCFWINLYNAFVQILVEKESPELSSPSSRTKFFSTKKITIANHLLSLNDMEHGMLRHSSVWWSLGYLKKIFVNYFEKKFRAPLDFRIHFALNCGATSCPAIAFYTPEKLDEQLEDAMQLFLESETSYEKRTKTVYISSIFNWYRGDFGGKRGIINLLWRHHLIPDDKKLKMRFKEYDWSTLLKNFSVTNS